MQDLESPISLYDPDGGMIVGPYHPTPSPFVATVAIVPQADEGGTWLLMAAPSELTLEFAARAIALIAIHRNHPIFHPVLNPRCESPPSALLLRTGAVQTPRGSLPDRFVNEVKRIAAELLTKAPEYVVDIAAALRGGRPPQFQALPPALGFSDPTNEFSWAPLPPSVSVNVQELAPFDDPEALLKLVASDYRRERYLIEASDEEVIQRAEDAIVNAHQFPDTSKHILLDVGNEAVVRSLARFGEAVAELETRHGTSFARWAPDLAKRWNLPDETGGPLISAVLDYVSRFGTPPADGLAKFGRKEHLFPMLETGRIRLSPAALFSDPSLTRAQQATELEVQEHIDPTRTRIEILDENRTKVLGELKPLQALITKRAPSNFFVFCTSRRLSARLFFDFNADACLLISDRREFLKRFTRGVKKALPEWLVTDQDCKYYDPYSRVARHASIPFWKPIRYEYQVEHRIVVVPPEPIQELAPQFIELGPLNDIATLFIPLVE